MSIWLKIKRLAICLETNLREDDLELAAFKGSICMANLMHEDNEFAQYYQTV